MSDCATSRMRFETQTALALEAAFDGGRVTSDGGLLWLAETDSQLGLCEVISEHVPEWRKREGCHSLNSLIRQRVFQIACGYEDQNDSNSLREDPLLKVVCGSLPESGPNLASQPTISRLENAADVRCCYRIARALLELYLRERGKAALRRRCYWTSMRPTIPPTESKKAPTTTATTGSTCTIPCSSSTGRVGI